MENNGSIYDTATGALTGHGLFSSSSITADVAGFGPVTVAFRPGGLGLSGTVAQDGSASFALSTYLTPVRITVGGETWSAGPTCSSVFLPVSFTGTASTSGLSVSGDSTVPFSIEPGADCDGREALVEAVLGGPVRFHYEIAGSFPAPPPSGTATTTTLDVVGPAGAVGDQATVRATVTTVAGFVPSGSVYFYVGSKLIDITYLAGGVTTAAVDLDAEGPLTVTAYYMGYSTAYAGSSATTTFTVAGPPPGRTTTGSISVGTNPTTIFPVGTRLTGADFDPMTGDISTSSFWFPTGFLPVDTGIIGTVQVKYRISQTAPMTGHVAADGTVTFASTALMLQARSYGSSSSPTNQSTLSNCTFGPIPMTLTGTADAGGLHLHADDTMIPPVPSNGCSGLATFVNPRVAVSTDLAFEVAGDFRRFAPSTPVQVATYFPAVAQYNQSYFVAHVDTATDVPTGTVTFRDGPTVLGTSPLDATGHASLVASMDQPGTRTITATYDGDPLHGPGSDTTTVDVTPAPTGLTIDGSMTVSGQALGIGAGSQLIPASGTTGAAIRGDLTTSRASLWFTPTTIPLDLPGYGPAQVEVRLFQYGQLSAATITPDGTINGLNGTFVLQIRKITTATTTTTPLGCLNLVLLGFDGHLTYTDVGLTTHAGGAGRIPLGICTGPGQAAIDQLAGGPVTTTIHAPL